MIKPSKYKTLLCALPLCVAATAQAAEVKVSGYAKLDSIYDVDQRQGDLSFANQLTTGDAADNENGGFDMHARESRIIITAKHEGVTIVAEGDFFGTGGNELVSNSNTFRSRKLYGQYGNWRMGQDWSTFMDFMAYPKSLDFGTNPGVSFIRQALIRYSAGGFSAAIENPEARISDAANNSLTSTDPLPDIVVKYRNEGDHFGFYTAGLVRSLEAEVNATGDTESTTALAVHAGIVFKFSGGARLGASVITGAPGRYSQERWSFEDAVLIDGDLEAIESTAFELTYKQPLGGGSSLNAGYGILMIDDEFEDEVVAVGGFDQVSEFFVNYIMKASKNVDLGFEVSYGEREDFNGDTGDNTRLQFSGKYSF